MTRKLASVVALALLAGLTRFTSVGFGFDSSLSGGDSLEAALDQISVERMLADIRTLSGSPFRGRQAGSAEDAGSALFVLTRFSDLRLHRSPASPLENQTNPLPQREWRQTTPVPTRTIDDDMLVELMLPDRRLPLHVGSDLIPVLDSPSADVAAPIIFVGYGISDQAQGIDDYAGLDVRDKIVLFLRGKPEKYKGSASHADKEGLARQKGAVGYLTATGPILNAYEQRRGVTGKPSAFYSTTEADRQLPGAWISTDVADTIIHEGSGGKGSLRTLQEELNHTGASQSRHTETWALLKWTSHITTGTLFNIVSLIRGYTAGDDAVLIGAHRDHFGQQAGLLFAGADDNASGTAVLLEVARLFAAAPIAPKRSILFVSFSGEEQGLLGSKLYISYPTIPLQKTIGMINVDHAGIGNGRLTVGVTGFEKTVAQQAGHLSGTSEKLDLFGFFPGGDHVPFKEAGVPTITVVSGGAHPHFHQPTDTVDTLDPDILRSVARYVLALAWRLANPE